MSRGVYEALTNPLSPEFRVEEGHWDAVGQTNGKVIGYKPTGRAIWASRFCGLTWGEIAIRLRQEAERLTERL